MSDDERAAVARCDEAWSALKVWLHGRECFALSSDTERVAAAERAWDALGDLLWPEVAP